MSLALASAAATAQKEVGKILEIIGRVDSRCMAADGPVTPTREEMTDRELRQIYLAAGRAMRALRKV